MSTAIDKLSTAALLLAAIGFANGYITGNIHAFNEDRMHPIEQLVVGPCMYGLAMGITNALNYVMCPWVPFVCALRKLGFKNLEWLIPKYYMIDLPRHNNSRYGKKNNE